MERVKVRVVWDEITSHRGDELVVQPTADIYLETPEVRVKIPPGERPAPSFTANYYRSFDSGDVDMELFSVPKCRTATEVIYEVHESEPELEARR